MDVSAVILVLCSTGYFHSEADLRAQPNLPGLRERNDPSPLPLSGPNCMRELARAKVTGKPIVALIEPEAKQGGMEPDEIRGQLQAADAPCEKQGIVFPSKYVMWGLTAEVESWGYHLPSGEQLFQTLFAADPIEWNTISAFQASADVEQAREGRGQM